MTRVEAEQLAYTRNRNDAKNNWVAQAVDWRGLEWEVKAYPIHAQVIRSRD